MVCIACLLPIFLIPIVNLLPLLFDLLMGKIYALFGKEYRRPERVPAACPYKPASKKVEPAPTVNETVACEKTAEETGKASVNKED
jgi:hypothetical protein